jgi:hypothetical protein
MAARRVPEQLEELKARLTEALFRVAGLVDSPNALMHPRMIMRVLRGARAG